MGITVMPTPKEWKRIKRVWLPMLAVGIVLVVVALFVV